MALNVFPNHKIITGFGNSVLQYGGSAESGNSAGTVYICVTLIIHILPSPHLCFVVYHVNCLHFMLYSDFWLFILQLFEYSCLTVSMPIISNYHHVVWFHCFPLDNFSILVSCSHTRNVLQVFQPGKWKAGNS